MADGLIAWRNVTRQWRRSAFALAAIAVGVAALMLATGFIDWNFLHYREELIATQLGHIQVHRIGYTSRGLADPYAYLLPRAAPQLDALHRLPGVVTVAPRLTLNGLASRGDATMPFVGEGVDPDAEKDLARSLVMIAGRSLNNAFPNHILLGQGLARKLAVKVGDSIVLVVNTANGGINGMDALVVGIFATVSKDYDDVALRMPIATARRLLRVDGAHTWIVLLRNTDETRTVLTEAKGILKGGDYEAIPWWALSDFYNKSSALFSKQTAVMRIMIAFLILLSISNALGMTVIERTAEIGTSMALGSRRQRILKQFLFEGLALGVLGALLGVTLGIAVGRLISVIGIPVPPPPGMANGYVGRILITWASTLTTAVIAIAATVLAACYPAWRASRMVIVDALRRASV